MPESTLERPKLRCVLKESTVLYLEALTKHFCACDDLATFDPYDVWKTSLGIRVKDLYNCRPSIGILPAGLLATLDCFVNNRYRLFYRRMEYPIVRALAAQCLLNLYEKTSDHELRDYARRHVLWLLANRCSECTGAGWGLGFRHAVSKHLVYPANTAFSTITPYVLEAFLRLAQLSSDPPLADAIAGILHFFDKDLQVMEEDEEAMATSYAPARDRIVTNAVSYVMYSYTLLLPYVEPAKKAGLEAKIHKLYAYIRRNQRPDGSWLYGPESNSFVDCFHSCIVLKNVIKTHRTLRLAQAESLISAGYSYMREAFLDSSRMLFRRFSVKNKPGLVHFDLYDNAEVLNLAILLSDHELLRDLVPSVIRRFCEGMDVYSQIDVFGCRRNKNTLRWAVMPFLYAASQLVAL